MHRPDACLFDLDGLLLDTEPCHGEAWRQAALHFGLNLSDARLLQLRGRRRADCVAQVRRWLQEAGHPVPTADDLAGGPAAHCPSSAAPCAARARRPPSGGALPRTGCADGDGDQQQPGAPWI